jgi:hypothetical protein
MGVIPNGTAQQGNIRLYNNSDPTNASILEALSGGGGEVSVRSGITGTGTYLPMTFYTGGSERMRIATDGQQSSVIPGGTTLYPEYKCRAWVNFNGTGTVAIRASGNVSSITDNGTGNYTVNFTTAMPDENYSVTGSANFNDTASSISDFAFYLTGTTGVRVLTHDSAGATLFDAVEICASIFR